MASDSLHVDFWLQIIHQNFVQKSMKHEHFITNDVIEKSMNQAAQEVKCSIHSYVFQEHQSLTLL